MIKLSEIQSTLAAVVKAGAIDELGNNTGVMTNIQVITDNGAKRKEIESALETDGVVVIVDLPYKGSTEKRAPGVAHLVVSINVIIEINPEVNSKKETPLDPLALVSEVSSSVLQYNPDDEYNRYETDDEFFGLSLVDEGLVRYVLGFTKMAPQS